jgi:hypothetical protein
MLGCELLSRIKNGFSVRISAVGASKVLSRAYNHAIVLQEYLVEIGPGAG